MTGWGPDRTALDRSLALRAERDRARRRLRTISTGEAGAEAELARRSARLHDEAADVEALESITLTRLLAAVRGTRTGELDRERAEEQEAAYAVRLAREDLDRLRTERQRLTNALEAMGTMDTWFDNIFSDLMVDSRIRTARAGVDDSRKAVDDALTRLARMENDLGWRRAQLVQRRDELLGIPPSGTED